MATNRFITLRYLWRVLRYGYDAARLMQQEERMEAWYVHGHRIPDDVRARAEKASETKAPDWYAGR